MVVKEVGFAIITRRVSNKINGEFRCYDFECKEGKEWPLVSTGIYEAKSVKKDYTWQVKAVCYKSVSVW
jgi:hypothetical protein